MEKGDAVRLAEAWREGTRPSDAAEWQTTYGRLVYLRPDADEKTAHLVESTRCVAFVADGHSWASMNFGLSAREILLRNGVQGSWIDAEIALGTRFKLVLFEDDGTVWPADWPGVWRAVEQYHPAVASKISAHRAVLERLSWEELEAQAGVQLDACDGRMTEDTYSEAADTPMNARRFLAVSLSLNRLFAGTGFTVDERDRSAHGTAEFFAANRLLSSVPPAQIVEL